MKKKTKKKATQSTRPPKSHKQIRGPRKFMTPLIPHDIYVHYLVGSKTVVTAYSIADFTDEELMGVATQWANSLVTLAKQFRFAKAEEKRKP